MNWHFTQNELLSQADKDLAQRSRWAPLLYVLIFTIVLVFTTYLQDYFTEVVSLGIVIGISALIRAFLVIRFHSWYPKFPQRWRRYFTIASYLLAASWGLLCMLTVTHYQLKWSAMLVLLITAGIAAIAVVTLSIQKSLVTNFLLLLLCPSIVMTGFMSSTQSLAIMVMFLTYGSFLIIVARRLSTEYWSALENTFLLDQRASQLEDSNKELESYSYSIAHDLRGPLRTITAFSQILLEEAQDRLNDSERDSLNRIVNAGKHLADLIDDILELSRITRIDIRHEEVNMSALAEECLQSLKESEPQREVEVRLHEGVIVNGDPRLLRIVIQNLLGNAWKFTRECENPVIQFGTRNDGQQIVYFVKDNGVGFDAKYSDKIFGIFQRLHSREEFEGTGIGLASVQRAIKRHNGKVWVNAKDQKGATFYFTLPGD